MTWLDSAIEKADQPVSFDVSDLGLDVENLECKPLSAAEFQTLKTLPEISKLDGSDRTEVMGLRTVYEMLAKCDDKISWQKFKSLPIVLLGELCIRATNAVGSADGGGALGE
tara:strand:+ start:379 stop:714 length:336 start_codon:yes stop_codon:yes gene_type:complete